MTVPACVRRKASVRARARRHRNASAQQAPFGRRRQTGGCCRRCRRKNSPTPRPRSSRRICAARKCVRDQGARRHAGRRYPEHLPLFVLGGGRAIRYGVRVGRDGFTWTGVQKITRQGRVAGLASADRDDRAPALFAALHGRRPRQSARRTCDVSRFDRLPHPRHQPAFDDRQVRLVGCIGMLNEDVSDLFERVKVGTRVVVMPGGPPPGTATASAAPLPVAPPRCTGRRRSSRRSRLPADRGAAAAGAGDGSLSRTTNIVKRRAMARLFLLRADVPMCCVNVPDVCRLALRAPQFACLNSHLVRLPAGQLQQHRRSDHADFCCRRDRRCRSAPLVSALLSAGHSVAGPDAIPHRKADTIRRMGAEPVVADALDAAAIRAAVSSQPGPTP